MWFLKIIFTELISDLSWVQQPTTTAIHDDIFKWKPFPRNWPFVGGIHRSLVVSLTKASDTEL